MAEILLPNKNQIDQIIQKGPFNKTYGVDWDVSAKTFTRINDATDMTVNVGTDLNIVENDFDVSELFGSLTEVEDDYGNVFIKWPKTYLRKIVTPTRVINQASLQKKPNYYRPAMFWDFTSNKELDYVLVGKHKASLGTGNKLESKPNQYPLINKNIVEFRTYAITIT